MSIRLSSAAAQRVAALALAVASLVAAAAVGSIFLTTARDAWAAIAATGPAGPADGILLITGLGGGALSLWLGLGLTLSALSALPGALGQVCRELAGRVAPAAVRKVVAFVLGTTLTAALVPGTAVAGIGHESGRPLSAGMVATAPQAPQGPRAPQARQAGSGLAVAAPDASFRLLGGPPPVQVPDARVQAADVRGVNDMKAKGVNGVRAHEVSDVNAKTVGGLVSAVHGGQAIDAAPDPGWSLARAEHPSARVVVHRGDTLWSIVARHLGPASSSAEIDAQWHRWYAANRDVIGEDANLILPGQVLRPPPAPGAGS